MSTVEPIPFIVPSPAPRALEYMEEALRSGDIEGDGPFTRRASALLQRWVGPSAVLLTTSCTHALELGALAMGIGPDDEVVMPSFTFVSTANAFALRHARVRFADVDPGTFTMGVAELEAALTPQTTTVVAMPYGGITGDIDAIRDLCAKRGIRLVEDNAHGLFATFKGQPLGSFGAFSTLSFHKTKNVTCGEGGALVLNDRSLVERAEVLREKGTDRSRFLRGQVDKYTWRDIGSSYLPSDILAALLVAQLENADQTQARRHAVWEHYATRLQPLVWANGIALQEIPEYLRHPAHLFAILVPPDVDRGAVLEELKLRGIRATSHYEPLHLSPLAQDHHPLPVTVDVAARIVRLPMHAELTPAHVDRVCDALLEILQTSPRVRRPSQAVGA